jgi:ketosteroid isomerase-like protein
MKNLIGYFAILKFNSIPSRAIIFLLAVILSASSANAQAKVEPSQTTDLSNQIAAFDAALFDAYNKCDVDKVGTFFAEDLEFYHEKGGLTLTREGTLNGMRKNLCGNENKVRRELIKNTMFVSPINNYGAVQTGEHRFYLTQKGQKEKMDGIGKFVMLWRKDGEQWKISRVISFGYRAPE